MMDEKKSSSELLKEEQDRIIKEIKKKAEKRKHAMNPDSDTGNEYVK